MNSTSTQLYKYRQFDDSRRNLRIISHSELWFSCAKSFNDPFDTAFTYNFEGLHDELAERWALDAADRHFSDLPLHERRDRAMRILAAIRNSPTYQQEKEREFVEDNYRTFGICSFAGSYDNLLMWAHYAASHTGFCVGFSGAHLEEIMENYAKQDVLLDRTEVKYSTEAPRPNFFESMLDLGDASHVNSFIATKSIDWKYEQEQRLVYLHHVDEALSIGHAAITEVILGCRISSQNRDEIVSLCRSKVPHARILRAEKDDRSFALKFNDI